MSTLDRGLGMSPIKTLEIDSRTPNASCHVRNYKIYIYGPSIEFANGNTEP